MARGERKMGEKIIGSGVGTCPKDQMKPGRLWAWEQVLQRQCNYITNRKVVVTTQGFLFVVGKKIGSQSVHAVISRTVNTLLYMAKETL